MALALLAFVLTGLSFATGALQAQTVDDGWQLCAYDTAGTRRLALTVFSHQRPDIAIFDPQGQRFVPFH